MVGGQMKPRSSSQFAFRLACGLILLASLGLSSCKQTGAGKRHKLAFVTNNASDFWTIARKGTDRKSTRLNSSHLGISYAVFCLKKKTMFSARMLPVIRTFIELSPGVARIPHITFVISILLGS